MDTQPNYLPVIDWIQPGIRKNRSVRDGYTRGWGLQHSDLRQKVLADPLYEESLKLAAGRSVQAEFCRMNLFLILKYYLGKLDFGHIVEFGAYRGGSAIFMAAVCRALHPDVRIYAFDTFAGMPVTDHQVDAHGAGDFHDVDLDELQRYVADIGLTNLELIKGKFEEVAAAKLKATRAVTLAHLDCDIKASVAYAYEAVKPWLVDGGYIVFDDAHTSSCIGATEAVEDLVIRRDRLNSEQVWPHFVFRAFKAKPSRASLILARLKSCAAVAFGPLWGQYRTPRPTEQPDRDLPTMGSRRSRGDAASSRAVSGTHGSQLSPPDERAQRAGRFETGESRLVIGSPQPHPSRDRVTATRANWFVTIGLTVLLAAPALLTLLFVDSFGVNLPVRDDWDFAATLVRFKEHHLTLEDLWAQHTEHRILVPRVLGIALAGFTHWNLRAEMFLSVLLAVVTFVLLAWLIRQAFGGWTRYSVALAAVSSGLLFCLSLWQNWLWGFQTAWFLPPLCLLGTLVLQRTNLPWYGRLGASLLLLSISTFSMANGMICWMIT